MFQNRVNRRLKTNVTPRRTGSGEFELLSAANLFTSCKLHGGVIQAGSEAESDSDSDDFPKGQERACAHLQIPLEPSPVNVTTQGLQTPSWNSGPR